jgi:hypothetical protein
VNIITLMKLVKFVIISNLLLLISYELSSVNSNLANHLKKDDNPTVPAKKSDNIDTKTTDSTEKTSAPSDANNNETCNRTKEEFKKLKEGNTSTTKSDKSNEANGDSKGAPKTSMNSKDVCPLAKVLYFRLGIVEYDPNCELKLNTDLAFYPQDVANAVKEFLLNTSKDTLNDVKTQIDININKGLARLLNYGKFSISDKALKFEANTNNQGQKTESPQTQSQSTTQNPAQNQEQQKSQSSETPQKAGKKKKIK